MNDRLVFRFIEYKFINVPILLKGICCKLCSFSTSRNKKGKLYCGEIPGSGCCYPFKEGEYYGYWKKASRN